MRWDPHYEPSSIQPDRAVLYSGTSVATAAAEVWQAGRIFRPRQDSPVVVRFTPTRTLKLLDLTAPSKWAIRNGAFADLPFAAKDVCRAWSRLILDEAPSDLDGLLSPSTVTGLNVTLFPRGCDAISHGAPDQLTPASDPLVTEVLRIIAKQIGFKFDG